MVALSVSSQYFSGCIFIRSYFIYSAFTNAVGRIYYNYFDVSSFLFNSSIQADSPVSFCFIMIFTYVLYS